MPAGSDVIRVRCPACDKKLGFPSSAVGRKAKCPACEHTFRIPESEAAPAAATSRPAAAPTAGSDGRIKVRCPACDKKLSFPQMAVGRKAKCAACEHVFVVQEPQVATVQAPSGRAAAEAGDDGGESDSGQPDDMSSLYDLAAAAEESGEAVEMSAEMQAAMAAPPPSSTFKAPTANYSARGTLADAAATKGRIASVVGEATAQLLKGTLFSAAGAVIGAFIWFFIAKAINMELSYVAWALGGMVGLGMHIGMGTESLLGGLIAGAMSIGGIVLAKLMIVAWLLMPIAQQRIAEKVNSIDNKRVALIGYYADEMAEKKNIDLESEDGMEEYDAICEVAELRVAKMTDPEVERAYEKLPEDAKNEADPEVVRKAVFFFCFLATFGLYDILFMLLAVGTAFMVGYRGVNVGER